jgi:hypothetical protein
LTLLVIKDMRKVPKRLRTGDKPDVEVVKVKVRVKVKVKSDDDEEEEELDNDAHEEDEDKEQVAQPVARVEWPGYIASRLYVPPRPNYILMDYDESMGDEVIPDNKVIRPMIHWCYTKLDPMYWGENSIDRCLT